MSFSFLEYTKTRLALLRGGYSCPQTSRGRFVAGRGWGGKDQRRGRNDKGRNSVGREGGKMSRAGRDGRGRGNGALVVRG